MYKLEVSSLIQYSQYKTSPLLSLQTSFIIPPSELLEESHGIAVQEDEKQARNHLSSQFNARFRV